MKWWVRLVTLNIGIELPEDHITQKCSIFGITGTGKSNGLGVFLEEYCKKNMPFVCIDVMGAHYGLAEKYKVAIYGGKKGVELEKDSGWLMANAVYKSDEHNLNSIFDVSEWNDFEMQLWIADFLTEIFRLHSEKRTPRHIFVEEAEVFFPQNGYDESKKSLLAGNKVMKRGRSIGLGMTLISQRPQDVNKKTLSQSQANFLLHLEGVPEMKVVREMLRSETREIRDGLISKITTAKKGECLLYSPQWIGKNVFFKFRVRDTFHAGYTPELGKKVVEPVLVNQIKPKIIIDDEVKEEGKKMSATQLTMGILLGLALYVVTTII